MSWAEIKKVNSNLDVPLDRLIRGNELLKLVPFQSNQYTKVVDVTGSGEIISLAPISLYDNDRITIEVDGDIIMDLTYKGSSSTYVTLCALEDTIYDSDNTLKHWLFYADPSRGDTIRISNISLNSSLYFFNKVSGKTFFPSHNTVQLTSVGRHFCILPNRIKFNKSLKVWFCTQYASYESLAYTIKD